MMSVVKTDIMQLRSERDIVLARQMVRGLSQELKFSLVEQTKMVTADSELARNTLTHGQGGTLQWELVSDNGRMGLRLCFSDQGPGIADMSLAMTDGWTSGGGMGLGLTGSKRLVNEFDIESSPGEGTRVTITRWK
jgi:serine/threonine-protein kinase RsbT